MRTFTLHFTLFVMTTLVCLELLLRVFQFASMTMPQANVNGNKLGEPNTKGINVKGGMGEIRALYNINNQGWNSTLNYKSEIRDSQKIALVGDSYIEGYHTSVLKSAGRQFEELYSDYRIVYEFGHSGGNIVDFSQIYEEYDLHNYFKVFVLITDKDLIEKKASFMGKGKSIPTQSLVRDLYGASHLLRYLNINHHFSERLIQVPSKPFRNQKVDFTKDFDVVKVNKDALNSFGENVVFLYEDGNLSPQAMELINHPLQPIIPIHLPDDCGFDKHWNENGRKNCALAMKAYLDTH